MNKYKRVDDFDVNVSPYIYKSVKDDQIDYDIVISQSGKRLDHYAFDYYGDGNLWWIIAAASGIGWWLQMPEGVVLHIPQNIDDVQRIWDSV